MSELKLTLDPRGGRTIEPTFWDVSIHGHPDIEDGPICRVYANDYRKRETNPKRRHLAAVIFDAVRQDLGA